MTVLIYIDRRVIIEVHRITLLAFEQYSGPIREKEKQTNKLNCWKRPFKNSVSLYIWYRSQVEMCPSKQCAFITLCCSYTKSWCKTGRTWRTGTIRVKGQVDHCYAKALFNNAKWFQAAFSLFRDNSKTRCFFFFLVRGCRLCIV